jgi:hypothetical protein
MTTTTARIVQIVSLHRNNRRAACSVLRVHPELRPILRRLSSLCGQIANLPGDLRPLWRGGLFGFIDCLVEMDRVGHTDRFDILMACPQGSPCSEAVLTGRPWAQFSPN